MKRWVFVLFILLGGFCSPEATAEDELSCAYYIGEFIREEIDADRHLYYAITNKSALFEDMVMSRAFRLLGARTDFAKPGAEDFLETQSATEPYTLNNSFSRFFRIAVQRELDSVRFGPYSAPKYKDMLGGAAPAPGIVVIFWPSIDHTYSLLEYLEENEEIRHWPRVLVVNSHFTVPKELQNEITRAVYFEGGIYPDALAMAPLSEPGRSLPVVVLGGPVERCLGMFLAGLTDPALTNDTSAGIDIRFHADFTFTRGVSIYKQLRPLREGINARHVLPFYTPITPFFGESLEPLGNRAGTSGRLPSYEFVRHDDKTVSLTVID